VIAIGCAAGFWQISRAHQKIDLAESMAAKQKLPPLNLNARAWTLEEASQRRVVAKGNFLPAETIWLDNRPRPIPLGGVENASQSGFYVMTPLRLAGTETIVWVKRGWAPRNNEERTQLPPVSTPSELTEVEGIAMANPGKVLELGKSTASASRPRIEQNFDLDKEAQSHAWPQLPFILQESVGDGVDGLMKNWAPPTTGVDRHYAYAFQWFALAFSGFLFWLITGLMQQQKRGDKSE
jgi:cytochrome oxidase assembly protein ShyY1